MVSVQHQVSFVVIFTGGRIARSIAGGKNKTFLEQHVGKQLAFRFVYPVCLHADKLNAFTGKTESVIEHLQLHPLGHRFHQEINSRLGSVDCRRHTFKGKVCHLNVFRADCFAANGIGKTLVCRKLTHIKRRKQAVYLLLRIGVSLCIAASDLLVRVRLNEYEVAQNRAVHRKRGFHRFGCKECVTPRQLPYQQNRHGEIKKYFTESNHLCFIF